MRDPRADLGVRHALAFEIPRAVDGVDDIDVDVVAGKSALRHAEEDVARLAEIGFLDIGISQKCEMSQNVVTK